MSRGLTFWNDDTIQLIREHFVAVSVPTWVCRSDGPEGEFLRGAGIDKQWVTSSGYMTCVSASGKRLGFEPCETVLQKFAELPESERLPKAVAVPDLAPGQAVIPAPPAGGIVLRVHARFLGRDEQGRLRHARPDDFPLMQENRDARAVWPMFLQPNTECLWLTRDEWRALIPAQPVVGEWRLVDAAIPIRMARFHLTPQRATTSEGHIVAPQAVKSASLKLRVEEATPDRLTLQLVGHVHWGSEFDAAKATSPNGPLPQGFDSPLQGRIEYDRRRDAITRFDMVAPGDVWGRWGDANGKSMYVERPGRAPFGFALELATGDSPTDRIPPGGNGRYVTDRTGYFTDARAR